MTRARGIVALAGLLTATPLAVAIARAEGSPGATSAFVRMTPAGDPSACSAGMVLVDGEWCPRVEQQCLRWLDPPGRYHDYRCAEYSRSPRCLAPREHKRFCIDRRERTEKGSGLPLNAQSWNDAKRSCDDAGARVCMDSEWTFACEGESMRPYPYGWRREASKCNADKMLLLVPGQPWRLRDERDPAGAHPQCASPFGVLDMAGNVAEWVSVDGHPDGSAVVQKGNWWQPGKHACRDAQWGHDRFYKGTETGFRCCAHARDSLPP
jgi:formylglycine-generating enzyme required for sulfatase activity